MSTESSFVHFRVAATLTAFLALTGVAAAQSATPLDSFEYADSPTNHGWVAGGFSPALVQTSPDQHAGGLRSVFIPQGTNITRSLVLPATVRSLSIMYFDNLISGTNFDVNASVFLSGGSCAGRASIGIYNPPTYYVSACGEEFTSTVPRSAGWHRFEWRLEGDQLVQLIDGTEVRRTTLTGPASFSSIQLAVGTEDGLSAHFDELTVTADCTLDLDLVYANGALTMNFTLGTTVPRTWNVWLTFGQNSIVSAWSVAVPAVDPAVSFPVTFPLGSIGNLGVLTTLATPGQGPVCSAFKIVRTQ